MKVKSTPQPSISPTPVEQPDTAVDELELRQRRIAEAAYYRAVDRGFASGYEWDDWLAAEAELYQPLQEAALDSGPL